MKQFTYTVNDPVGIHARPAGMLVKEAKNYTSTITIEKNGKAVNALKLMALMGLGVRKGDTVTVAAEGDDEDVAIAGLEKFFNENL